MRNRTTPLLSSSLAQACRPVYPGPFVLPQVHFRSPQPLLSDQLFWPMEALGWQVGFWAAVALSSASCVTLVLLGISAGASWAAQTRPRRRVRNRTSILCLSWSFFCRRCGCPSGWRGCKIAATFIACMCWRDTTWTNGCSSYDHSYNGRHLQYPGWQR